MRRRSPRPWRRLLVAAALVFAGCGDPAEVPPEPAAGSGAATGADVLLLTIDTLRADTLGFAGHPRVKTPVLDALAAEGRVFPRAHGHNVVTLPSHANILTGQLPYQHGIRDNGTFTLPDTVPTLATVLRQAGYRTGAVVAAFPLDSRFGLDRGFELYDDAYPMDSSPSRFQYAWRPAPEVVERGLSWWREHRGERRFLWLHLWEPHYPYEPPSPFAEQYPGEPYLGEIAAVDAALAPLLQEILAPGAAPALVVLTSDHGESLGEHDELTHSLFAYEATLRVPLVIRGPGIAAGNDLREARHIDLLPTLVDALGLPAPPGTAGRSLLTAAPSPQPETYFEALSANLNQGWAPLRGILRDDWKAIDLPIPELYELSSDPGETVNRIDTDRRQARELLALLPEESSWPPERRDLNEEEVAALRSLGYASGGSAPAKTRYTAEDDPKNRNLLGINRRLNRAVELHGEGRFGEAVTLLREVLGERPSMPEAHFLLAQCLLDDGRRSAAVEAMEAARRTGAANPALLRQLALSLTEMGQPQAALEALDELAPSRDPGVLTVRGITLSELGRQEEARADLTAALGTDPDDAHALESLGMVALRQGRIDEAEELLERSLARDEARPQAWNMLGVARFQGRQDAVAALEAWNRALELDPAQYDVLYNFARISLQAGRTEQGLDALRRFVREAPEARYGADLRAARAELRRLGG